MQNPRVPQGLTRLALFAIAIAAFLLVAWRLTPTSARLIIAVIAGFALLALLCVWSFPPNLSPATPPLVISSRSSAPGPLTAPGRPWYRAWSGWPRWPASSLPGSSYKATGRKQQVIGSSS